MPLNVAVLGEAEGEVISLNKSLGKHYRKMVKVVVYDEISSDINRRLGAMLQEMGEGIFL